MAIPTSRQDKFPNYMSWTIDEINPQVFETIVINTPIPRNQIIRGNKATILELLWLVGDVHNIVFSIANEFVEWGIKTGATPTSAAEGRIGNGNVIAHKKQSLHIVASGGGIVESDIIFDFQSKDGFGMLLATDSFHAWMFNGQTGIEKLTGDFRLYYRFVQVPVTEYIGIVQSQQSSN